MLSKHEDENTFSTSFGQRMRSDAELTRYQFWCLPRLPNQIKNQMSVSFDIYGSISPFYDAYYYPRRQGWPDSAAILRSFLGDLQQKKSIKGVWKGC